MFASKGYRDAKNNPLLANIMRTIMQSFVNHSFISIWPMFASKGYRGAKNNTRRLALGEGHGNRKTVTSVS